MSPRPLLLSALLITAAAVLLAACESERGNGGATSALPPELEDGVLSVGSDISFPPFEFFEEDVTTPVGIDIDLAQALAERLGVEVEFRDVGLDSRIPSLEAGRVEVIISAMTITEERRQRIDFIPYFRGGSGVLVPGGNPTDIQDDQDLCSHTVAVQRGTIQVDQLEAKNADLCAGDYNIDIEVFPSHSQAAAELRAGAADAVLVDYPVALDYALRSEGGLEVIDFQMRPVIYGIGVRKSSPELKEALTQALVAIIQDGSYDTIIQRWGAEPGTWKEVAS